VNPRLFRLARPEPKLPFFAGSPAIGSGDGFMQDRARIRILPPVILGVALGLGVLSSMLASVRMLPTEAALVIGLIAVAGSFLVVYLGIRELMCARTALDVRKPTTAIVTTGVFGFSRNPIYLAMMLLYVGVSFLLNSALALLLAVPFGCALFWSAIKPEEQYLAAKFGDTYHAYRSRVRRWL
jgi:protein-S-isoprenylcysteine O-methyltransferase Ste14